MIAPPRHSPRRLSRRSALCHLGAGLAAGLVGCQNRIRPDLRLATFAADVTVPLDHGMMGGAWKSRSIADPLEARGFVLTGDGPPVVFVSVDWCEIRNQAYRRWQEALAAAAGTRPDHVLVSTIHQHDAPVADLAAEMGDAYPELREQQVRIDAVLKQEEERFGETLEHGVEMARLLAGRHRGAIDLGEHAREVAEAIGERVQLTPKVGEHLRKYRDEDQASEVDPEWALLRSLIPEVFDPLLREELTYLDALPNWAPGRSSALQ